jgi:hypothetical protein
LIIESNFMKKLFTSKWQYQKGNNLYTTIACPCFDLEIDCKVHLMKYSAVTCKTTCYGKP